MICEGEDGGLFEVTRNLENVWEYLNPFIEYKWRPEFRAAPSVYRAYRVPCDWISQLKKPVETSVTPTPNADLKIRADFGRY